MKKLIFILLLISCEPIHIWQTCTFTPERHESNVNFWMRSDSILEVCYRFNDSYIYDIGEDQSDKNKLFGIAPEYDCDWDNLSFRISIFYQNDSLHIGAYVHDLQKYGEKAKKVHIKTIPVNSEIYTRIEDLGNVVYFTVDEITISIDVTPHETQGYVITRPYFGGNKTAPHKITFEYKIL